MFASLHLPNPPDRSRLAPVRRRAFTLIEIMVSLAILSISTMGGVAAFMTLNRYAANLRNMSVARALCQERIEQALTLRFLPPSGVVPLAPNADPNAPATQKPLPILGAATYYNTSTSAFSGGSNLSTGTETIPIYTQTDGTSAKGSANVTYTRSATVSPASSLMYVTSAGTTTTSLNVVQFTVTVSYVFHGTTYSTSMSTLRCPN